MQPASRLTYRFAQESNNEPMQHHADLPLRERVQRYFQSSQWYPAKVHRTHNTFHENRILNAGGIKRSSCKSKSEPQPKLGTQNFRHRRMRITKIDFPKDSQLSFAAIKLRKKKNIKKTMLSAPIPTSMVLKESSSSSSHKALLVLLQALLALLHKAISM